MKWNPQMAADETLQPMQFAKASYPCMETQAKVLSCHIEFARMHAFTLGFFVLSAQFLISFTYYAHVKIFNGRFNSPAAIAQTERFSILYSPLDTQQNNKSTINAIPRTSIAAYMIGASIAAPLRFLLAMRECQ